MKSINLLAGVALVLGVVAGCNPQKNENDGAKKPELHIYTWSDYIAPDVIQAFEKKHSCKVVIDTFDSNETMYAKLKAGATGYDIIMPSSYQIKTMVDEGMIQKIDHEKLPNVRKNFAKQFLPQIIDPSFTYNVPYAVTYTGFAYLKDKVPAGVDVNTWQVLANPALRGKISLLDDQREVIGAGLMSLGYSINTTSAEELDKAVAEVLKWKENIRKFDSESYKTEVASGAILLGQGYSTDVTQLIVGDEEEGVKPRPDVGFALPKEGFAVAFDEMVIAKDAKQIDLAYAFINTIYDPEVAKDNMEYICGPNPVGPAIEMLDEDYRKMIILDEETMKRGQVIRGFDGNSQVIELYNKAWDKIKASR